MNPLTRLASRVSPAFVAYRVLWGVPVLLAVITVSFIVLRFTPGGPFDREKPLPEAIEQTLRKQYRLDRPILPIWISSEDSQIQAEQERFVAEYPHLSLGEVHITLSPSGIAQTQLIAYFADLARGDLGMSMKYAQVSVNELLAATFPVSLQLGAAAFALAYLLGIGLGVLAAFRRGTWVDKATMVFASLGFSMPNFILGAFLILVFALWLDVLPAALWEGPAYAVLPVITLALAPASYIARLTRSGVIEALHEDYVRTARAKGVSETLVVLKHALANALGPLITISGPLLAMLVTGSFIVELIFAIPGMGRYFITAVIDRDYPLVMGVTILYATLIVIANIVVDVLYAVVDPRVSSEGGR